METLKPCHNGQHTLREIYRDTATVSEIVVRWCSYCGAIVVDQDIDGRTMPGAYMKIRFPQVVKELTGS